MWACVVLCAWRTRLLHPGAAADYFVLLSYRRRGARAVQLLGAAGPVSNKATKGAPSGHQLGGHGRRSMQYLDECCSVWGLAPPHLCLDVSQKALCSITIPVQLLWYFGLLCCVSKSMFYLSCFCTVCWYFSFESSVNRSTMSLP